MAYRKALGWRVLPAILLASPVPAAPPPAAPAGQTAPAAGLAAVDAVMARALAAGELAGAVVGVMRDGRILATKGYGLSDIEDGQPVRADTIFRIGSITKQFTTALLMMLVERGQLSLDDPISRFFPDFPKAEGITVRHLLNHTSGIHSYTDRRFVETRAWREHDTAQMLSYIAGQDDLTDFPVGQDYRYNNSGYVLAGAIVEKLTGTSYAAALQAMILTPLGLRDTAYDDERLVVPRRAKGYAPLDGRLVHPAPLSVSVAGSAGALRSTAADMLRWHAALLGGRVVKPESLARMIEPSRLADGRLISQVHARDAQRGPPADYGLGLEVGLRDGRRVVGHYGTINGFNACLYSFPDEHVSIVLLTNTEGAANRLFWPVADAWLNQGNREQGK